MTLIKSGLKGFISLTPECIIYDVLKFRQECRGRVLALAGSKDYAESKGG